MSYRRRNRRQSKRSNVPESVMLPNHMDTKNPCSESLRFPARINFFTIFFKSTSKMHQFLPLLQSLKMILQRTHFKSLSALGTAAFAGRRLVGVTPLLMLPLHRQLFSLSQRMTHYIIVCQFVNTLHNLLRHAKMFHVKHFIPISTMHNNRCPA